MLSCRFVVGLAGLLLTACEPSPDLVGCVLTGKNYLGDTDFELEAKSGKSRYWTGLQHVGKKSYQVSIADAVVSIDRTGPEPWFVYRQTLGVPELAGQLVAFTALVRLVDRPAATADRLTQPAGLKLAALGSGKLKMRAEQSLAGDHPSQEWQRLQLIARLPPETDTVRVNFYHEAYGVLQVRAPAFQSVDPASRGCAVTPVRE